MLVRQFSLNQMPGYPFENVYDLHKVAFFDIETTGFAAEATYLYLIGCAYYKDSSFHLIQWFSEDFREEAEVISSFFEFLKDYEVLVHYNGTGFDIPYLQHKAAQLSLDYNFNHLTSLDIYKRIYPYKKIFKLGNLKLKTLEAFLSIPRKDTFDGGDLIQVYQSYLGKKHYETLRRKRNPSAENSEISEADLLLQQLLLHNEDDIRGLLLISPILNYADLFEKPIHIIEAGIEEGRLHIRYEISACLPVRVSFGDNLVHLTACESTSILSVQVYEGELKHFYDNYRDYYYLPAEDCAVHKSVAQFVDKEYREKAKSSNCYVKKQGIFVPQYETVITPCFKLQYQDKVSFLEIHTENLLQENNLEIYVSHLLTHMFSAQDKK